MRSLGQITSKENHFQRKSTSCNYLCNNFKHKADESKSTKIIPSNKKFLNKKMNKDTLEKQVWKIMEEKSKKWEKQKRKMRQREC